MSRQVIALVIFAACTAKTPTLTNAELAQRAKAVHREAQKSENLAKYTEAEKLYAEYVARVPDDYDMAFFYAELLFKVAEHDPQPAHWERAAVEYQRVVTMKPDGSHLRDAAYGHVISMMNALGIQDGPCDGGPPTPTETRFLRALDFYIDHVPDNPQRVVIQYRKARSLYDAGRWDEAVPIFADVAIKHPEHELGVVSANLLLDCLNLSHKTTELRGWVDRFARGPLMKDAEFAANIDQLQDELKKRK